MAYSANTTSGAHRPHIATIQQQAISELVQYSGIILSVILIAIFLVRHYVFQGFLFKWLYGELWTCMDDRTSRSFINHHIGGVIKIMVISAGVYPWLKVVFEDSNLNDPLGSSLRPSMGDLLSVLCLLFSAMYIFELGYREKLSIIAVFHHIGAIIIGQVGLILSLNLPHNPESTIEFLMCVTWGAFDALAEFWPNLAMILYRRYKGRHALLSKVLLITAIVTVIGTVSETIVIMWLMAQSWSRWSLVFKISTPIFHTVFMAAQIHGSRNLYSMYKSQKSKRAEEAAVIELEMGASRSSTSSKPIVA
ncbi:hypothetical protein EJ08DRAFT_679151 [Tothia fuscella]|uniref:TLC domain-containing protein n=1 Tax=Tothia fuscella TaxID=1048955 RepID=A0A9P4NSA5_9PEZI|nr:hypothetical protein EJ08DRAFT_679151 [Tothia fuscella]